MHSDIFNLRFSLYYIHTYIPILFIYSKIDFRLLNYYQDPIQYKDVFSPAKEISLCS